MAGEARDLQRYRETKPVRSKRGGVYKPMPGPDKGRAELFGGDPMSREVDFAAKPIDPDFMNKPDGYPETGVHLHHKVFAEGKERPDADGTPYPTTPGIHGTQDRKSVV